HGSAVAVEPARRAVAPVAHGMSDAPGNKDLVAGPGHETGGAYLDLQPALHHRHHLVDAVDEAVPFPARRVDEQIAGIATRLPRPGDRRAAYGPGEPAGRMELGHQPAGCLKTPGTGGSFESPACPPARAGSRD